MAARLSAADFQRDVAARSGAGTVYTAVLNPDNVTYKITARDKFGNLTTPYAKILYNAQGVAAITDAGGPQNEDTVTVYFVDGTVGVMPAQVLINQLNFLFT